MNQPNTSPRGQDAERDRQLSAVLEAAYPAYDPSPEGRERVARLAARRDARTPAAAAPRLGRWRARLGLAAALAAGVLLFAAWPRLVAAQALRQMEAAVRDVHSAHLVFWKVAPDGRRHSRTETWYSGDRVRSASEDPRRLTLYADGRYWVYDPAAGTVTVRRQSGYARYNPSGLTLGALRRDFARWGWRDRIRVVGTVTAGGRAARRVAVERDEPAGPVRLLLWVDEKTDLPFRFETQLEADGRWVTQSVGEATYNEPLPARLFEPDFPRSAKVIDRDREREQLRERLARGLARRQVGERTVTVRDVQVSAEGDVFLLYTAGKHPGDSFRAGNILAGRDWKVEVTDEFGTEYLWLLNGPRPAQAEPGNPGFTFDGERLEGDSWTPKEPQVPWKPRRLTFTFRVSPVNHHGGFDDPEVAADHSETVTFTVPVGRPTAALLPDYLRHLSLDYDEDSFRKLQAEARGVLPPGVTPSPELAHTLLGNADSVFALSFSPDGGTVASGAWDSGLRMWDVRTGRPRGVLSPDRPHVKSVAFSPDGRRVAGVTQLFEGRKHVGDALRLWDRRTGRLLWSRSETDPAKSHLSSVTFSADGGTLASTGFRVDSVHKDGDTEVLTAMSAVATLREADTGKPRERRAFPRGDFSSAFTPSLEGLVTQERVIENQRLTGCFVRQWDLATGALLRTIPAPAGVQIMRTVVSPDGRLIAGAGQAYRPARPPHGPRILLWDAGTGQLLRTLTDREGTLMHALAFSPDGTLLAGAGDKVVRVWEVGTGRLRRSLVGHGKLVRQVAFSPDGRLLASGDLGGVILLWRLR